MSHKAKIIEDEPEYPQGMTFFPDIKFLRRPAILLSNKNITIDDNDLVLKTYAKLGTNVPMKANIKKTKKIIEKKINK